MENNLLIKYMSERIRPETIKIVEPGPVITISRECGCSGRLFAEKLTEQINNKINNPAKNWKWVNKEILCLASKELKMNPNQVKHLLKGEDKNFLEEFASSFTVKYYASNAKIKRVIKDVVRHLAIHGNVVIIGRGSEAITQDIKRSLHIKLYAPFSWKVDVIKCRNKISVEQAKKFVIDTDKRRLKFVDAYLTKDQDKVVYDIEFNCAKFSQEEIIEVILKAAQIKSLL
ncbi:MAG: cytidylate kinase-like family protein [Bacteroidia bacterium]|nr:cytidylate kinase-like family protein [Bacteroidia bacterium]